MSPIRSILAALPHLDAENSQERRRAALVYGGGLALIAALTRFAVIGSESYWTDEVTMVNIGLGGWNELLHQFNSGRPALFVFISYLWTTFFGTSEVVTRLVSCLASIISVAVLFHLGARMFNQRVGFIAAVVLTVSQFHIYYAQTFRYYAVYVLLVILSYLFFYLMITVGRWYHTLLYSIFSALSLYAHTHGLFVFASQGLYFLFMLIFIPKMRNIPLIRRWFLSQIMLAIFIFPGLWHQILADIFSSSSPLVQAGSESENGLGPNWLSLPTLGSFGRALIRFIVYEPYYLNIYAILTASLFFVVAITFYIWRIGMQQFRRYLHQLPRDLLFAQSKHQLEIALVVTWFLGMLVLPWVLSFIISPMFYDRYVLGSSPPYYLLLALVALGIRRVIPAEVTTLLYVAFIIPGLLFSYQFADNEQWRELAAYLRTNIQADDVIVVVSSQVHLEQPFETFNWYYPRTYNCKLFEDRPDRALMTFSLTNCLRNHTRAWVVAVRWVGTYPQLANLGLSSTLVELFQASDSGRWRLTQTMDGEPFHLLGLYLYENSTAFAAGS